MARRSRQVDGTAILSLLVIMALAFVGPLLIAGLWLYYESTKENDDQAEARLAQQDRLLDRLHRHEQAAQELMDSGDAMGLARRGDDMFDARSTDGRTINRQIEALREKHDEASTELESLGGSVAELAGARAAVATYAVIFAFTHFHSPDGSIIIHSALASAGGALVGYLIFTGKSS